MGRTAGTGGGVNTMIDLKYDLVIEATAEGFTGVGHSIEDCLCKAKWGMEEHVELLREQGMPVPEINAAPTVVIQNEAEKTVV